MDTDEVIFGSEVPLPTNYLNASIFYVNMFDFQIFLDFFGTIFYHKPEQEINNHHLRSIADVVAQQSRLINPIPNTRLSLQSNDPAPLAQLPHVGSTRYIATLQPTEYEQGPLPRANSARMTPRQSETEEVLLEKERNIIQNCHDWHAFATIMDRIFFCIFIVIISVFLYLYFPFPSLLYND